MKCSDSIANLAVGLAKFNGEVSRISKDAANPFFKNKYATLDTIIDEIRPILTKYGLSVMQFTSGDGENVTLKTILLHESGEWIESENLTMKPVKNDPQAVGSAVTYARRYSLAAFFSLNTGEDDDGNRATHPDKKTQGKPDPNAIKQKTVGEIKTQWLKMGYKIEALNAQIHKLYGCEITGMKEEDAQDFLNKLYETERQQASDPMNVKGAV